MNHSPPLLRALLLFLLAALLAACATMAQPARKQVVLQISDDNPKSWTSAFNVVNNLKATYGKENVDIEVIAFSDGIHALTFDSKAAPRIVGALGAGTKVIACGNSMNRFKLTKNDMAPDIEYVQAGVQRIIDRQQEGWTVIRP